MPDKNIQVIVLNSQKDKSVNSIINTSSIKIEQRDKNMKVIVLDKTLGIEKEYYFACVTSLDRFIMVQAYLIIE